MATRSPIEETFRGGGGGGVQTIEPGGGGGAQIARPGESAAPNYVGMYSEATRAALEPAKFMWGMYKDREELSKQQQQLMLRGQELDETKRSNLIKESQTAALQELDRQKEEEIVRHNKADEARAQQQADIDKAKEEYMKPYYEAQSARADAETSDLKQKLEDSKKAAEDKKNDDQVIAEFNKKIDSWGPMDHYSIEEHPELADVYQSAFRQLKTPDGEKRLSGIIGQNTALGQELARHNEMSGWTKAAHDAFIADYNDWNRGPEAPNISGEARFNRAFAAGADVQSREMEKNGYWDAKNGKWEQGWGDAGFKAYNSFLGSEAATHLTRDEAERKAMALGRDADEKYKAEIKQKTAAAQSGMAKLKPSDIKDMVQAAIPKKEGESEADYEARTGPYINGAISAEENKIGGANEYLQQQQLGGKAVTTPGAGQTNTIDTHAKRLLGEPNPSPTPAATPEKNPEANVGYNYTYKGVRLPASESSQETAVAPAYTAPPAWGTPTSGGQVSQNIPLGSWDYWNRQFNPPEELA